MRRDSEREGDYINKINGQMNRRESDRKSNNDLNNEKKRYNVEHKVQFFELEFNFVTTNITQHTD